MLIKGKRIRNPKIYLGDMEENTLFTIGNILTDNILSILIEKFGLVDPREGEIFFPSPLIGIMCKRNAVGEFIPQKDKPKETAYKAQEWDIKDWGGYSHSGTAYVPYKRFPRKFIDPKEHKLVIRRNPDGDSIVTLDKNFRNNADWPADITFAINLFLEIFEHAQTFKITEENDFIDFTNTQTVNWEILPKGERVWEAFNKKNSTSISPSEQYLIKERFDFIESFKPDSIRKGIGGYTGYLVFEFQDKNLYIFDSILYGEATYIFEDEWENASKLTKKEIINNNLSKDRIIHNKQWQLKLRKHLF